MDFIGQGAKQDAKRFIIPKKFTKNKIGNNKINALYLLYKTK